MRQDGRTAVMTAPNGMAQQNLYRDSVRCAGYTTRELDICALHGTGTSLGDPIEAGSLASVICAYTDAPSIVTGIKVCCTIRITLGCCLMSCTCCGCISCPADSHWLLDSSANQIGLCIASACDTVEAMHDTKSHHHCP